MKVFCIGVILVFLTAASVTSAEDMPNFTGTFELNAKKGKNLGMVAAVKETILVTQTADTMVIDFTDVFQGNTTTRQVTYDLSGEPMDNFPAMGDPSETVSGWKDDKLVTTWTSEGAVAGTEVVRTEIRSVSDDGQIMTVETRRGERSPMVMVYDRTE